jgi:mRNA-degrading endonuclease RelE of RelBE toxin-antitoxin system
MNLVRTHLFKRDFLELPENIKRSAEKALRLFVTNPFHPSLHIKKTKGEILKGYHNIFEGRLSKSYRFLFLIEKDSYVLLRCGKHDEFFK